MKHEKFEALHGELMDATKRDVPEEERALLIRWILQRYLRVYTRRQWTLLFGPHKTGNTEAPL
jgi:hypothetical protein